MGDGEAVEVGFFERTESVGKDDALVVSVGIEEVGSGVWLGGENGVEHGEERGDTATCADKVMGAALGVSGSELEVAAGRKKVNGVAFLELVVNVVGDEAAFDSLNGDAERIA